MRKTLLIVPFLSLLAAVFFAPNTTFAQTNYSKNTLASDQLKAQQISKKISSVEVLAPLAPVALSPFFGITCLSGTSILCNRGVLPKNEFLMGNNALNNILVFALFLGLTVITSVPKMTAVSKGFSEAADFLETYAGIITYMAIIYLASSGQDSGTQQVVYQAGIFSFTKSTLLMAAAVVNIIVINTVKFFFELLIWISPIPALDAAFEAANKVFAAILVTIYAFNPYIALVLNIILFLLCLPIFNWARRNIKYYRSMYLWPIIAKVFNITRFEPPGYIRVKVSRVIEQGKPLLKVFPSQKINKIKKRDLCWLIAGKDRLYLIKFCIFVLPKVEKIDTTNAQIEVRKGLLSNTIQINAQGAEKTVTVNFSKVYNRQIESLADSLRAFGQVRTEAESGAEGNVSMQPETA